MEDKDSRIMLEGSVTKALEKLNTMELGSDEYGDALEQLETLYKLKQEDDKLSWDADIEYKKMELEKDVKTDQNEQLIKDRFVKLGINVAELILPLLAYGFWFNKGLKFERGDAFSSLFVKGLIGKMKPTKK